MKKQKKNTWDAKEQEMLSQLKEQLEEEKVPLGVYPSLMRKKLEDATQNEADGRTAANSSVEGEFSANGVSRRSGRGMSLRSWAAVVGCLAVFLVGIFAWQLTPGKPSPISPEPTSLARTQTRHPAKASDSAGAKEVQALYASSYEQIFERLMAGNSWQKNEFPEMGEATGSTAVNSGSAKGSAKSANDGEIREFAMSEESMDVSADSAVTQTNVQVEGVDEADIFKTDGTFLYILQGNEDALRVVAAENGQMEERFTYRFPEMDDNTWRQMEEMYVSDGVVTVISSYYETVYLDENDLPMEDHAVTDIAYRGGCFGGQKPYVMAESFAVGEDGSLISLGSVKQDGYYRSSRKTEGVVYLFTSYEACIYHTDGSVKEEYIPRINDVCLPADSIVLPEQTDSNSYLVCSSFYAGTPAELLDFCSVLVQGYGCELYMSKNAIYFTNCFYKQPEKDAPTDWTEILKYTYAEGSFTPVGRQVVAGYPNDSFSLDEYDGYLRMVVSESHPVETVDEEHGVASVQWKRYNHLYVLDETLEIVGKIEQIAEDETIQSSRFLGPVGYFVTFRTMDPLFSVDLSDPTQPVILGELKIPGFSSYLHFYSDTLLLGLGEEIDPESGKFLGIKLSMFDISDPGNVQERDTFVIPGTEEGANCEALYNHKALLVNTADNYFGFAVGGKYLYNMDEDGQIIGLTGVDSRYCLYGYDEDGFFERMSCGAICEKMRALVIGEVLYVCSWNEYEGEQLEAFDMANAYANVGSLTLEKETYDADQTGGWGVKEGLMVK